MLLFHVREKPGEMRDMTEYDKGKKAAQAEECAPGGVNTLNATQRLAAMEIFSKIYRTLSEAREGMGHESHNMFASSHVNLDHEGDQGLVEAIKEVQESISIMDSPRLGSSL